ncbi:MAG: acyltransferase [Roseburia sp.]|nr:acyltransferase [Anaeroplasma bactoclasticum]MCM1196279.1 acyltransferase [Roseburia sp.]MCM1557386.1 acyltransferase [Anaeroplasma bactoclasticum]
MRKIIAFFMRIKYRISLRWKKIKIKLLYGKRFQYGKKFFFRKRFEVRIDKGQIIIGDNCFFNNDCSINSLNCIYIGRDCIFGENVKIYDHNHRFDKSVLIGTQGYKSSKITIGNNCWLGSNVTILSKAQIGNNCIIGAGTVINENIPDDSIVTMERNILIKKREYKN